MAYTHAALRALLDASPATYGAMGDAEVATYFNTQPGANIDVQTVSAADMQAAVDIGEYIGLTDAQRSGWLTLLTVAADGGFPVANTALRAQIAAIWAPGTTRTNLVALQTKSGTLAEQEFGDGFALSHLQVAAARAL